jgi:O-acetyl-ADP-ribose deacetylase (regulator of RNase III)
MRHVRGDLFDYPADAICVTTNGIVNGHGLAVMGRGVALEAATRFPWLRTALAERLMGGNHVYVFDPEQYLTHEQLGLLDAAGEGYESPPKLATFPVKHHWREMARPKLIARSAEELLVVARALDWETVALPRPGCGNGGLLWSEVEPILDEIFGYDDRFVIVDRET